MFLSAGQQYSCLHLTSFVKVPLPPFPQYAVSPGRRATLLTGVVILREEVVLVRRGKI